MRNYKKNLREKFGLIGVLMGGDSPEREISLESGDAVYRALKEEGANVKAIDIKDTKDTTKLKKDILKAQLDVAFIAMHGAFGEDGGLQTILDELKIPYTGSGPEASRLAMDKIASRRIFESNGIPVPKFMVVEDKNINYDDLSLPLVVKPSNAGSSIGLSIIREEKEVERAFLFARSYSQKVILEEYQHGEEITVGILEEQTLPVIMLKPKEEFYNYKAKYTRGLTEYLVPAPLEEEKTKLCQKIALKAHRALGLWCFSRVDMILKDDKTPVVLEANSIPGLTPLSLLPKAAKHQGLNFNQLCIKLLESAFKRNHHLRNTKSSAH
jgi:D-alanine-D-alanine ligase